MSGYVPNPPKNHRYAEAEPVDLHAQRWAEYEKHSKEPAPEPEKIGIALRIGVFFDGTGNNANNTAAGHTGSCQAASADLSQPPQPIYLEQAANYISSVYQGLGPGGIVQVWVRD